MRMLRSLLVGAVVSSALVAGAAQAETVKIAFIDPLSGLMASLGTNQLHSWQYTAEFANEHNWANGTKFEVVGFDNKLSPQESLTLLSQTALVNVAPDNPFIDASVRTVQEGHFLNFYGLTQFSAALWPFLALAYLSALAGLRRY